MIERALLLLAVLLPATGLFASPTIDICLRESGAFIEVILISDSNFNGFLSNVQFTMRAANSVVLYEDPEQGSLEASYIPMKKAGPEKQVGNDTYMKFAGLGIASFSAVGLTWEADKGIILMRIKNPDPNTIFTIVNDGWTSTNNGDLYIELNGEDRTGSYTTACNPIINSTDPLSSAESIQVYPNPTVDVIHIDLPDAEYSDIRLFTLQGTMLQSQQLRRHAEMSYELSLAQFPVGTYLLEISNQEQVWHKRIIKE